MNEHLASSPGLMADVHLLQMHMNKYHWFADHFRWEEFKQLFTEDATFEVASADRIYRGRDEIVSRQSANVMSKFERTQHVIVNCLFEVDGDEATGHANLIFTGVPKASNPAANYMSGGMYRWRFKRDGSGWRTAETKLEFIWQSSSEEALRFFQADQA